jgi:hypothetical protein
MARGMIGTCDPLCDLAHLRHVLQPLHSPAQVYEIGGGNHSFKVPKRSGRTDEEIWQTAVQAILNWLRLTVR